MKIYKRRPDVELLEVCGEYLLAAAGEARGKCPYITQINASAAELWRVLEGEMSVSELAQAVAESKGKEAKDYLFPAIVFVSKMSKSGQLIEEDRP